MITPNNSIIGFDGKKALNNLTGIGNYSRFIINALSGRNPKTRFCLFAPKIKIRKPAEISGSCPTLTSSSHLKAQSGSGGAASEWYPN